MRNSFFCADIMRACYVHFSMSFRIGLSCMSLYPFLFRSGSLIFSLFRVSVPFLNSDFSLLFFRSIFSNPGFFRFRFSVFQFCSYFSVFEFLFLFFRFLIFCFSDFRFPACMFFRVFVWTGKSHETDAETAL